MILAMLLLFLLTTKLRLCCLISLTLHSTFLHLVNVNTLLAGLAHLLITKTILSFPVIISVFHNSALTSLVYLFRFFSMRSFITYLHTLFRRLPRRILFSFWQNILWHNSYISKCSPCKRSAYNNLLFLPHRSPASEDSKATFGHPTWAGVVSL